MLENNIMKKNLSTASFLSYVIFFPSHMLSQSQHCPSLEEFHFGDWLVCTSLLKNEFPKYYSLANAFFKQE